MKWIFSSSRSFIEIGTRSRFLWRAISLVETRIRFITSQKSLCKEVSQCFPHCRRIFLSYSFTSTFPLSTTRDSLKTGRPDSVLIWSIIIIAAVLSHSLFGSQEQVLHQVFCNPGPKNIQRPRWNSRAYFPNMNRILMTIFYIIVFSTHNIIENGHEDDSFEEVLRFTLYTCHEVLKLSENTYYRGWEDFSFELCLHTVDTIQFLVVLVLGISLFFIQVAFGSLVVSSIQSTKSEKTQTLTVVTW